MIYIHLTGRLVLSQLPCLQIIMAVKKPLYIGVPFTYTRMFEKKPMIAPTPGHLYILLLSFSLYIYQRHSLNSSSHPVFTLITPKKGSGQPMKSQPEPYMRATDRSGATINIKPMISIYPILIQINTDLNFP